MVRKHFLLMSNQTDNSAATCNFSFRIQDHALAPFTHLKLFNGYNEIVSEGFGNMNIQIPRGLYQLRIEMNEHVEDRKYRVSEDTHDTLEKINTASSMPVQGLTSTHEYFAGPVTEWSRKSTTSGQPITGHTLFIFLRYSDPE